ncbi:MAG: DoxX family protein [Rhodothermales bacterium]
MLSSLQRYADLGLLVLRIGVGLSYVFLHGWGKMFGGPERWERTGSAVSAIGIDFGHTFWGFMAAFSEFAGGILIVLGLFFRPACILIFITMFVAAARDIAGEDGIRGSAHPLKMAFVFLGLTAIGPGRYSVDSWLAGRRAVRSKM